MPSALLSQTVIECILSHNDEGLTGEGCIYDPSSSSHTISQPEHLRPGDYVKLQLWLPEESVCVFVELAEVQWVQNHWINVEVLSISPENQARLRKFASVGDQSSPSSRKKTERILIHA